MMHTLDIEHGTEVGLKESDIYLRISMALCSQIVTPSILAGGGQKMRLVETITAIKRMEDNKITRMAIKGIVIRTEETIMEVITMVEIMDKKECDIRLILEFI